MPLTPSATRTKSTVLFVLFAVSVFAAVSASPFVNRAAAAGPETVQTFAADCATPKTTFWLGETVCVKASNFPLHPGVADYYRRFNWSAPGHRVAESDAVKGDPDFDTFSIPSSGDFAVAGKWRVQTVDIETNTRADATFTVRSPRLFFVDLSAWKAAHDFVLPGDRLRYKVTIFNDGPDVAEFVQLAEDLPVNATFYALKQSSGPVFECRTPAQGQTGRILCSTKYMKSGDQATFDVYVVADERASAGDLFQSRTVVGSNTEELNKADNTYRYTSRVVTELKEIPTQYEEVDNPRGVEWERADLPKPEAINPEDYKGDDVRLPEPEKDNPPDYRGDPDVIWPEPEIENP
ncbi:MAG TPA: hypothetical protein VN228_10265 [Pyrinomonadaceae bacterium]|nr:hypothetical protein [Pyrinomonadaceae bacterium]